MLKLLVKNAISVTAEKGVMIVMTLITTPILLEELGATSYGVWILLINMVAWARMSNLGFGSSVSRTAGIYLENNTLGQLNALFNSSLLLNIILGLAGVTIVLTPVFFPEILELPSVYIKEANIILICLGIKVLSDFLLMSVNNFFSAALKENVASNISVLTELVKALATIYLVLKGYGIIGMLLALMLSDLIAVVLKVFYIRKIFPELKLSLSFVSLFQINEIFSYSKYILLANVALIVRKRMGVNIVSKYADVASVATFNIAHQLVSHCEEFINVLSAVVGPAATRVLNREDKSQESKYISMLCKLNLFSTLVVLMPLILFADAFVHLWLGDQLGMISSFIKIFAFSLLTKFIFVSAQSVMMAKAKHKSLPIIHIFGTLITILLTIFLANIYGVYGIVCGLVISSMLTDLIFFTPVLLRELASERSNFLKIILIVSLVSILEFYYFSSFDIFSNINSWMSFLIYSFVFSLLNMTLFWFVIFDRLEKQAHIRLIRSRLG